MDKDAIYDVCITGGGLAGLASAILLGRSGYKVVLYEKESYPFHKVCGEYISMESWNFLRNLGLPLPHWSLPAINTLTISAPGGSSLTQELPLGGFGISRYRLDEALAELAGRCGVTLCSNTRVQDMTFNGPDFSIAAGNRSSRATVCLGAFGKRSNLDIKWNRAFTRQKNDSTANFIAVKYHAEVRHPENLIALHNFKDGYCGISRIEDGRSCICYLTTARNLRLSGNNIQQMEKEIVCQNPHLRQIFADASFIYEKPLTISQVSFAEKEQVENHILMMGDAAGLIAPLCGNGMSMALHSAKIASGLTEDFLSNKITRTQLEAMYTRQWKKHFSTRLRAGRMLQQAFGREWTTNLLLGALRPFPSVVRNIIRLTHAEQPF